MLRVIEKTHFNVHGFAGGTADIGVNGANLPTGVYHGVLLASSSFAIDVDTDENYIYNETTQVWRKQT